MKRILLFLLFSCSVVLLSAQDIPKLIISEVFFGSHPRYSYVEVTNIGTTTADLTNVWLNGMTNKSWNNIQTYRIGTGLSSTTGSLAYDNLSTLEPGESFLIGVEAWNFISEPQNLQNQNWDAIRYNESRGAFFIDYNYGFYYNHLDLIFLHDNPWLGTSSYHPMRLWNGDDGIRILYDQGPGGTPPDGVYDPNVDIVLDQVGIDGVHTSYSFAGITNSSNDHLIIRKPDAEPTPNNETFIASIGDSPELSDWMAIPLRGTPASYGKFFTTVGIHGGADYTMDISSTDPAVVVGANTIDMPWGVRRDSLQLSLDFGPNMGWYVKWGPDTLESVVVQTGDTLEAYLCNSELEVTKYVINVLAPPADLALIFPRLRQDDDDDEWYVAYNISDDIERLTGNPDTIWVPYEHRLDTLLTYTEIAEGASWEISSFAGEETRSFLKYGDILTVTAPDGTTKKDYFVKANKYIPSENTSLETILLDNDTLFNFRSSVYNYKVTLPEGVEKFPVIDARPLSGAARVSIQRPVHIRGGVDERTAVITVIAENDTVTRDYRVSFEPPLLADQDFVTDPIVSEFFVDRFSGTWSQMIELYNPSSVPISLSDYVVLVLGFAGNDLTDELSNTDVTKKIRPGYTQDSTTRRYRELTDLDQLTTEIEARGAWHASRVSNSYTPELPEDDPNYKGMGTIFTDADFFAGNSTGWHVLYDFADGCMLTTQLAPHTANTFSIAVTRIDDANIWSGDASAIDNTEGDILSKYILTDVWGSVTGDKNNHTYAGVDYRLEGVGYTAERKPEIVFGNPISFDSYGTTEENCEWNLFDNGQAGAGDGEYHTAGSHNSIMYLDFVSTISSIPYVADVTDEEFTTGTIQEVEAGTSVDDFLVNIIKGDPGQSLVVKRSDVEITTGNVAEGDVLEVTSKDGLNTTVYAISLGGLGSVATISSSVYTVASGSVSGIPAFTTVADVLGMVTKDDPNSTLYVVDDAGRSISLSVKSPDTLAVDPIEIIVNGSIWFEVIAENGVDKEMYQLVPDDTDLPYITSDWYNIDQERNIIYNYTEGKSAQLVMDHIWPSAGASVKIYDKQGFERTSGTMYIDDYFVVTDDSNPEKSQTYVFKTISSAKEILSFTLTGQTGSATIDAENGTIAIEVAPGTDVTSLTPVIEISYFAMISPESEVATDFTSPVTYTVTAEDESTKEWVVTVTVAVSVGVNKAADFVIYPNPTAGQVLISGLEGKASVRVYDILGQTIQLIDHEGGSLEIDLSDKANGVYLINISEGERTSVVKLIKE
jgi:hypothetical protein